MLNWSANELLMISFRAVREVEFKELTTTKMCAKRLVVVVESSKTIRGVRKSVE